MKRRLEARFGQLTTQATGASPNLPNLHQQLEMVDCTNKDHPNLSEGA